MYSERSIQVNRVLESPSLGGFELRDVRWDGQVFKVQIDKEDSCTR